MRGTIQTNWTRCGRKPGRHGRQAAGALILALAAVLAGCEPYSWGDGSLGRLGYSLPAGTRQLAPGAIAGNAKVIALRAGGHHSCGILDNNSLWCWGQANSGQLGVGGPPVFFLDTPTQVGTATDWEVIAPGVYHTCGIRSGQLWCWGSNSAGQLGQGFSSAGEDEPVRVGADSDWLSVSAGGSFTCGIRQGGFLHCWGLNDEGQLGVGDYANRLTPAFVPGATWEKLDAGIAHACAIQKTTGIAHCWGSNLEGQIENSVKLAYPSPTGLTLARQAVAGDRATCLRIRDAAGSGDNNQVYCFGDGGALSGNLYGGALPVGCRRSAPGSGCDIRSGFRFQNIDLGFAHACGVEVGTRKLWCWGEGDDGQLGDGAGADAVEPVTVAGTQQWARASTGVRHTLAMVMPPLP